MKIQIEKFMAAGAKLDQFLNGVNSFIQQRDAQALCDWLVVDPPFSEIYQSLIAQLKKFDVGNNLHSKCQAIFRAAVEQHWNAFIPFIVQYILFLRDIDVNNLLGAYELLGDLVEKCNIALAHPSCGELLLPTVVSYSQLLAQFAIRLDKQPQLLAHIPRSLDDEFSETLPERAANLVRRAFVTCLNDRTDVSGNTPTGRRAGIYKLANTCLKILFSIKKTGNAEQIFTNIYSQAPPVSLYPRAQRVTYLYYLGRFLWTTNHWYRAQLALESAYLECPRDCLKQRRFILVFLIASNMILGRFPSADLYARPEAEGLMDRFHPLCQSIAKGDLETFRRLTASDGPHARWFLHFRILLQIRNRCEILVWRSLARKVFLLRGKTPQDPSKAPSLNIQDFLAAHKLLHTRSLVPVSRLQYIPSSESQAEWILSENNSPELYSFVERGVVGIKYNSDDEDDWEYEYGEIQRHKNQGPTVPDVYEAECIILSLIGQELLNGYVSHKMLRFAISGAKRRGALPAGFPKVWPTLTSNENRDVPGWKKSALNPLPSGGQVIHLTNARPVGAQG